jgi:hypothetical protein
MRNYPRASVRLFSGLLFAALVVLTPRNADACSCMMSATNCQYLATAAAVFEATVDSIGPGPTDSTFGQQVRVQLKNIRHHRGKPQSSVITSWSGASCGYSFEIGQRYLIVAGSSPQGDLAVSLCGLTRPIEGAQGLIEFAKSLDEQPLQTRVWGQVVRPTGPGDSLPNPVADAVLTFHGPRETTVKTGTDGKFLVRGLPPGSYSASATVPPSGTPAQSYDGDFELAPGVPHACAELAFFVPPTGEITGVILDDRGAPMPGAFVRLQVLNSGGAGKPVTPWLGTETDDVGRYYFLEIPPGTYNVAFGSMSSGQVLVRTNTGSTIVSVRDGESVSLESLQWRPPSKLPTEVSVRNIDGSPAPAIAVQPLILVDGDEPYLAGPPVVSDADGKFVVQLLQGQRYRLVVGSHRDPRGEIRLVADGQPLTLVLRR